MEYILFRSILFNVMYKVKTVYKSIDSMENKIKRIMSEFTVSGFNTQQKEKKKTIHDIGLNTSLSSICVRLKWHILCE